MKKKKKVSSLLGITERQPMIPGKREIKSGKDKARERKNIKKELRKEEV